MNARPLLALLALGLALAGGVLFLATRGSSARGGGETARPAVVTERSAPRSAARPIAPEAPLGEAPGAAPRRQATSGTGRVAAPTASAGDPPPTFQVVRGSVVTPERPLPGAHVLLLEGETPVREASTADDGSFELRVPTVLEAPRLKIVARGFATHVRQLPPMRRGELRLLGNLGVEPARLTTGVVFLPNGSPAAGATVLVESAATGRGRNHAVIEATTGTDGKFLARDTMPGPVWVTARSAGFGEGRARVEEGASATVTLGTDTAWSAVIRDEAGDPVAGAHLELASLGGSPPQTARTDADGRVRFRGLAEGSRMHVSITHESFWPKSLNAIEPGDELEVRLRSLPSIEGTIMRSDREPLVPGSVVRARPAGSRTTDDGATTPIDPATGRYVITGVTPGRIVVEARAPGFAPAVSEAFVVSPEGRTPAPIVTLRRGAILRFEVLHDVRAVANARVELFAGPPDDRLLLQPALPGAPLPARVGASGVDGEVLMREVPAGSWYAIVRAEGYVARVFGPLVARENERAEGGVCMLERAGAIHGSVVNSEGAALPATVIARGAGAELRLATDDRGRFEFDRLPPGTWLVEAHARTGESSGARRSTVEAGAVLELAFEL
ncbi:MAG: carboxypeptidase regulatory-like domain-containing protein [Planctomycetota bacterium]